MAFFGRLGLSFTVQGRLESSGTVVRFISTHFGPYTTESKRVMTKNVCGREFLVPPTAAQHCGRVLRTS